tara:strand:- start:84 stop:803 length:720 start_codon:yes stop_codon:yes gene_type:complete
MGRDEFLSYSKDPELWLNSIGITLFCIALLVLIGYYLSDRNRAIFTKFLGVMFFVRFIFLHGYQVGIGHWDITNSLPLHLCGISSIVCIVIMFYYNQSLFEYIVLLGIPSAIHSILTPQFINGWDGYYFPEFYFSHGAILLVPLYLTINYNYKLRKNAWKTAFFNGLVAAFVVGTINVIISFLYGELPNYMYICEAPIADNPLLLTSQWPYYFLMLIFFMFIHILAVFYIYKLIGRVEQ